MKKSFVISIIAILILGVFGGCVNAASASIYSSANSVNIGNKVTVSVSFGEKVSAAQFTLNFDSSKLEYASRTAGTFDAGSKRFSYLNLEGVADLTSVSFTFNTKVLGDTTVSISGLKISTEAQDGISPALATSSTTISIVEPAPTPEPTQAPTPVVTAKPTASSKNTPKPTATAATEKPEAASEELIKLDDKDVVTLNNEKSKVIIKGRKNAIEDKTVLDVNVITEDNKDYSIIEEIMKDIKGKKTFFNIRLLKDNVAVQPNGYVTVYIGIPEEYNKENTEVYYVDLENKTCELQNGEIQGDYYSYTTNHFSTYVLVDKEEVVVEEQVKQETKITSEDKTVEFFKDVNVLYTIIVILLIIAIVETVLMTRMAKNNYNKGRRSK